MRRESGSHSGPSRGYRGRVLSTLVNIPETVARPLVPADNPAFTALVRHVETTAFGESISNEPENLGFLQAPELHGTAGTLGLWSGGDLIASVLAFDELEHGRGLWFDLFLTPELPSPRRREIAHGLYTAGMDYGRALATRPGSRIKADSFAGDNDVAAVVEELGFEHHRIYWRMRVRFTGPVSVQMPAGYSLRTFDQSDADWHTVHDLVNAAFLDHYDFHAEPFDIFGRAWDAPTVDKSRWRIAESDGVAVGLSIASLRYAEHKTGYIDTLAVVREHRGRGLAKALLADAFARDRADGFTGTTLHCDSTNPTGATALYESVGMIRDQEYLAWQRYL